MKVISRNFALAMVTRAYVLLCYDFMSTVFGFPDSAIGNKYILTRSGNGTYALVPEGSDSPGIPVSAVHTHLTKGHTVSTFTVDRNIN